MKKGDVPLEPHVEQQLEELGCVDLLVGIPSYNNADTIAPRRAGGRGRARQVLPTPIGGDRQLRRRLR